MNYFFAFTTWLLVLVLIVFLWTYNSKNEDDNIKKLSQLKILKDFISFCVDSRKFIVSLFHLENKSEQQLSNRIFPVPLWWWEYIVLLRVPIITSLVVFLLPIVASLTPASILLKNLFVMRSVTQLIIVVTITAITTLMIVIVLTVIFVNALDRYPHYFDHTIAPEEPNLSTQQRRELIQSFPSMIQGFLGFFVDIDKLNQDKNQDNTIHYYPKKSIDTYYPFLLTRACFLALPTWITIFVLSADELTIPNTILGEFLGILFSILFFWLTYKLGEYLGTSIYNSNRDNENNSIGRYFVDLIKFLIVFPDKGNNRGYSLNQIRDDNNVRYRFIDGNEHLLGIALAIIGLIIYGIVIGINYPGIDILSQLPFINGPADGIKEAPALCYLLLIIWIATALFGGATFYADYYRIPLILFFVIFSGFSYLIFNVDHYFELTEVKTPKYSYEQLADFTIPIGNRLEKNQTSSKDKTLVVIAASGGGIQSAGWTIEVLRGLQEKLGSSFIEETGMISSTSGGSVGTMFLLDQLVNLKEHTSEKITDGFKKAFENATEDSLDAVGWGLAYPDLFRAIGFPWAVNKYIDRASAMEKTWEQNMISKESAITLNFWQEPIMRGKIPIPVFNATLVEDGSRFLISPMKFIEGNISNIVACNSSDSYNQVLDFYTLYQPLNSEKHYDLKITTGARLSASFPYVSPLARNDRDNIVEIKNSDNVNCKKHYNYHIADGGYFDNAGLFTIVEWLDKWLDTFRKDLKITRVLIVQINAFSEYQLNSTNGDLGWVTEFIGPLKTLYGVRNSTQLARNEKEAEILQKKWQDKVEIRPFTIFFPRKNSGTKVDYNQPLSWKLTEKQKNNLKSAWEDIKNKDTINDIEKVWTEWHS